MQLLDYIYLAMSNTICKLQPWQALLFTYKFLIKLCCWCLGLENLDYKAVRCQWLVGTGICLLYIRVSYLGQLRFLKVIFAANSQWMAFDDQLLQLYYWISRFFKLVLDGVYNATSGYKYKYCNCQVGQTLLTKLIV